MPFPARELDALLLVNVDGPGLRDARCSIAAELVTAVAALGQEAPGAQDIFDVAPIAAREAMKCGLVIRPSRILKDGVLSVWAGQRAVP